ncbi:MAG: hypothetical protein N3J91_05320 [Verrucomicrobiae bacterium]|nr:hypothetical protein [Verrucomicrobiae bacterium]
MHWAQLSQVAGDVLEAIHSTASGEDLPATAFNTLALRLANAQKEVNPVLAAFYERLPARAWNSWREIPPISVAAFKETEMTCIPPAERTHVFYSSGTTSQSRSRHWHHQASLQLYVEALKLWFARHVLAGSGANPPSQWLLVSLTPPPAQAPHSSLVYMLATAMGAFGLPESCFLGHSNADGNWVLDLPKTTSALESLSRLGPPLVLLGTAFNFVHLLDYLAGESRQLPLPPGSRLMETGGYKGRSRDVPPDELHAALQYLFAVPPTAIVREYGMCELSSQAYDRIALQPAAPARFRFPPWVRFRIVSPETGIDCPPGVPGLLCIYDLANVWSVMAIQTADLAVGHEDGFELLGRAPLAEPRGCSLMVNE